MYQIVVCPMRSRDFNRSRSWHRYFRMQISQKPSEMAVRFQRTTNKKWHMASGHNKDCKRCITLSARTVVGHSLLLARLPGTHWVTICVIQRLALTVSDVYSRLVCFQSTSTSSALEVLHSMRLYKFTTYLLTYFSIKQVTIASHYIYPRISAMLPSDTRATCSARVGHLPVSLVPRGTCRTNLTPPTPSPTPPGRHATSWLNTPSVFHNSLPCFASQRHLFVRWPDTWPQLVRRLWRHYSQP